MGALIKTWLTYTDVDNEAPTYVRVTRTTIIGFEQLQTPYPMVANGTGSYTTGKQYYYNWYYFPFANTGFIKFEIKSGVDAEVTKTVIEFQEPPPILSRSGVYPMNTSAQNYTFFTNYSSTFNAYPEYINVTINGIEHPMNKNNTGDSTYVDGVNYSFTIYLTENNWTYNFHTRSQYVVSGDQSSGIYWIIVKNETDSNAILFIVFIVVGLAMVFAMVMILRHKKED